MANAERLHEESAGICGCSVQLGKLCLDIEGERKLLAAPLDCSCFQGNEWVNFDWHCTFCNMQT